MAKKVAKESQVKKTTGKSFFEKYRWELIIFVFSVLLYANAIPNDYNMDDELVTINHRLTSKGISAIPEIFTSTYYKDNQGYAYEYRPMVLASFAIEHQIFGDKASASHLINVLLYGLCCVLLFRVLRKISLGYSILIPLGITLLFVAHPAHTEVVTSIKNRDEILGLIFSLLTWSAAFRVAGGSTKWLLAVPVFFMAAVMSKMSVLPFDVIIPLALILFTPAGFKKIMAVALLMAVATFIVLNNFLFDKLVISLGLVAITFLLFVFLRFNEVAAAVKPFLKNILTKPTNVSGGLSNSARWANAKEFFTGVIFDFRPYLSFQPILAGAAVALVYLAGILTGFPLLIVIGAVGFLALLVWGSEKTTWWANTLLYACLVFTLFKYPVGSSVYTDFVAITLVYQIFYGNRKLFIVSVLLYIPLFFLAPVASALGVGIMALASFISRWTWPLMVIYLVGGHYSSFVEFSKIGFFSDRAFYSDNYGIIIALVLIISMLLKRGTKTLVIAFQIGAIAALFALHAIDRPLTPYTFNQNLQAQIKTIEKKVPVNIVTDKIDRPVDFVEQPVNTKSPFSLRAGTALEILFTYLHKVVLPYPMAFYYGYRFIEPENITEAIPIISLLIYTALFLLAIYCLRFYKLIGFGLMIYLVSIASASSYFFPIPGQLGERFLFIPSLGWSIVLVISLITVFRFKISPSETTITNLPKGFKYTLAVVLSLYSVISFSRNFDWKDYTTLTKHDINYVSNSSQANNLMALNLMKKSYDINDQASQKAMRLEALGHFQKALEIYPRFYNVTYDIARVYNILGQNDSAIYYFKKAIALDSSNSNPSLFIGQMLMEKGQYAAAVPYLQFVLSHNPPDYTPYDKLSFAYFKLQDYNRSIAVNQMAIAKLPPQPTPYINIAHVFVSINQPDSARVYAQKAAQFNPNDQNVRQLMQQISGMK